MTRVFFKLNRDEIDVFNRLKPEQGAASTFWRQVGADHKLDYRSILPRKENHGYEFSGLPEGHKHHWCYPSPLHCAKRPALHSIPISMSN